MPWWDSNLLLTVSSKELEHDVRYVQLFIGLRVHGGECHHRGAEGCR